MDLIETERHCHIPFKSFLGSACMCTWYRHNDIKCKTAPSSSTCDFDQQILNLFIVILL